jgi:hypothetical protein
MRLGQLWRRALVGRPGAGAGRPRAFAQDWLARLAVLIALGCAAAGGILAREAPVRIFFYIGSVRFSDAPSAPRRGVVPLTNMMNEKVTVKSVRVERGSDAFVVSEEFSGPFVMAPGEIYQIPVVLSARKARGTASLRIVASTAKSKTDVVEVVKFHYEIR